jgi:hypothetical protein
MCLLPMTANDTALAIAHTSSGPETLAKKIAARLIRDVPLGELAGMTFATETRYLSQAKAARVVGAAGGRTSRSPA